MSSLFLKAKMIAPACSAAFPTIGSRIILMKLTERPQESEASSMVPTTYSDNRAMKAVIPTSQTIPLANPITGVSSIVSPSSSSSCASNICRCVTNWKTMYALYPVSITMLLALDNWSVGTVVKLGDAPAMRNNSGRMWHNNPRSSNSMFTSACLLSYFCSLLMLAMPPQKREVPRTKRRFESTEPRREYFTTTILL
uniref:Vacuolar cation/proton exchanger 1a n=1 Tax=Rhizophora mucronata TaxID=61149 RepID=A0A2P2LBW3_RHIMU